MRAFGAFSLSIALALSPVAAAEKNRPLDQPGSAAAEGWSGFYVGAFLGYGRGATNLATDAGVPTATSYFTAAENIASVEKHGTGSLSEGVPVAGIQFGANIQTGAIVFGVEADLGTFRMSQSVGATDFTYPTFAAAYTMRASVETDWLFTLRARAGWTPLPNLLIYATGGLAVTDLTVSNAFRDNAPSDGLGGTSTTDMRFGWTAGGGAELALARNWSLKAEYLYLDLGTATAKGTVTCAPPTPNLCNLVGRDSSPFVTSADLTVHTVRVGLNYRF